MYELWTILLMSAILASFVTFMFCVIGLNMDINVKNDDKLANQYAMGCIVFFLLTVILLIISFFI